MTKFENFVKSARSVCLRRDCDGPVWLQSLSWQIDPFIINTQPASEAARRLSVACVWDLSPCAESPHKDPVILLPDSGQEERRVIS